MCRADLLDRGFLREVALVDRPIFVSALLTAKELACDFRGHAADSQSDRLGLQRVPAAAAAMKRSVECCETHVKRGGEEKENRRARMGL